MSLLSRRGADSKNIIPKLRDENFHLATTPKSNKFNPKKELRLLNRHFGRLVGPLERSECMWAAMLGHHVLF